MLCHCEQPKQVKQHQCPLQVPPRNSGDCHAIGRTPMARNDICYRLSPSPLILPLSRRSYNLEILYSAISSSVKFSSVATCAIYHNTSPSSALSAVRVSSLICPSLSRNAFLILPATSPASLTSPSVG